MYGRDIFFLCGEEKKNEEKIYLLPLPFFLSLSLAHNFFSVPFSFPFLLAERMFPRKQIMYEKEIIIIIIRREREKAAKIGKKLGRAWGTLAQAWLLPRGKDGVEGF